MRDIAGPGKYAGATADERRDERRRRLLDAGLEVIGTQGWSQATTRKICETARIGPRFFYESFSDLDALAVAVLDEIIEDALANVLQAITAAPDGVADKARAAVETFIGEVTDDPRRARFLFAEAHGSEALMNRRFAAVRTIAAVVVAQAEGLLDLPEGSDRFLQAAALIVTGGIAEMVLFWLDGGLEITRDELVDLCVESLLIAGENATTVVQRITARPEGAKQRS